MKIKFSHFLFIVFLSSTWFSCTDDYLEFDKIRTDDWKPELAMPLINSTLTLKEIVVKNDTDGIVQPNPSTSVLEVIYDGRVFSAIGALAVELPNQNFQESFQLPTPIPPSPTSSSLNRSFTTDIDFNNNATDLEVDSIFIKNGVLQLTVQNDFQHNIVIEVVFPTIKNRMGTNLTLSFSLPPAPNSSSFSSASSTVNLNGYMADMTKNRNGAPALNKIPIEVNTTFNLTPNTSSNSSDEIRVNGTMNSLTFQEFYGYIGKTTLDLREDSIRIDLFRNFVNGTFFISNPTLDINVTNSFGAPIDFNFQRLIAQNNDKSPNTLNVQLPQNPIELNFPTSFGVEVTQIQLDNMNSNIDDVVSFLTKQMLYKSEGYLNPNGKTSQRNFLTDTSQIQLDVLLVIPFEGSATGFTLLDTIDFDFQNSDQIEDGLVRVRTENAFPIDADLQIYFLDENYNTIDSLYSNGAQSVIKSSVVNSIGRTIQNTIWITDTDISSERLEPLTKGRYAIISAVLNTLDAPGRNVKFYEEYRLSIDVGIKAKIKL